MINVLILQRVRYINTESLMTNLSVHRNCNGAVKGEMRLDREHFDGRTSKPMDVCVSVSSQSPTAEESVKKRQHIKAFHPVSLKSNRGEPTGKGTQTGIIPE